MTCTSSGLEKNRHFHTDLIIAILSEHNHGEIFRVVFSVNQPPCYAKTHRSEALKETSVSALSAFQSKLDKDSSN